MGSVRDGEVQRPARVHACAGPHARVRLHIQCTALLRCVTMIERRPQQRPCTALSVDSGLQLRAHPLLESCCTGAPPPSSGELRYLHHPHVWRRWSHKGSCSFRIHTPFPFVCNSCSARTPRPLLLPPPPSPLAPHGIITVKRSVTPSSACRGMCNLTPSAP